MPPKKYSKLMRRLRRRRINRRGFIFAAFGGIIFGAIATITIVAVKAAEPIGEWQVHCSVHHTNRDDPIVYPGQPGRSHMHSFYANTTTNASTTTQSLMAARSNCAGELDTLDRSAYWVPSLYKKQADGTLSLVPISGQIAFFYYQRAGGRTGPKVLPFPNGLRMIAGNPLATSAQPLSVVRWGCGGGGGGPQTAYIPSCSEPDQPIHSVVDFPSCWNGHDLDSTDHKSHMAYAGSGGVCPGSHPVSLPQLHLDLDYTGVPGGPAYSLSSGGQYSMHADFFAAWDVQAQNTLVSECINMNRSCTGMFRTGSTIKTGDGVVLNMNAYSSTPLTSGTLPSIAPPAPQTTTVRPATSTPKAQPVKSSPVSATSPTSSTTASDQSTELASAEQEHAAHTAASASIPESDTKPKNKNIIFLVIAAVFGVGVLGGTAYLYLRRRSPQITRW